MNKEKQPALMIHAAVIALALLLALMQPESGTLLSLNRTAVFEQQQWWRLITGHFVHLSWAHTLLNCGGLCLIIITFSPLNHASTSKKQREARQIGALFLIGYYVSSALLISLALLYFDTEIHNYFGLSGILYGLLALYIAHDAQQHPYFCAIALTALFLKIVWDQFYALEDHVTANLIGGPVASSAHLYGGVYGLIAILTANHLTSFRRRPRPS